MVISLQLIIQPSCGDRAHVLWVTLAGLNWGWILWHREDERQSQGDCTHRHAWLITHLLLPFPRLWHVPSLQQAWVLLPPLCPMVKGKVFFVFILEILGGITGSFWTPLKKCHHWSFVPKKPMMTVVTEVLDPQEALGWVEDEVMAEAEPPAPTDPTCYTTAGIFLAASV